MCPPRRRFGRAFRNEGGVQPAIWLVLFGHLWESAARPDWAGESYLRFMTAGAVMMTVFNVSLMGGLEILVDRERGALDRFLVAPVHPLALVSSRFTYVTAVGAAQTLAIVAMAGLLGVRFAAGWWTLPGLLLLAVLLGAGVCAASLALAFTVKHHGQFYTLTGLVSLPLVFLSSVFAPLDAMPGWLGAMARFNPITYAVDAARALVIGGATIRGLSAMTLALWLFIAFTMFLAHRAAQRHLA